MGDFLIEFQNQRRRKKDVWEDVAREFQKYGNTWTAEDCRKKWSNMIRTFKGIEEQRQDPTSKAKRVKWPFYDSMFDLLNQSGADSFPESTSVVQLLKNGASPSPGPSSGGCYGRKISNGLSVPNVSVHPPLHSPLLDQQTLLNLNHETDVLGIGVPEAGGTDIHTTDLLFADEPTLRYTRPEPQPTPMSTSTATATYCKPKPELEVRPKKKPVKKKLGKFASKSNDDSADGILSKFMEETKKHNEQILEKLTVFHSNTITLMQERNELLKEIRDDLRESNQTLESSVEDTEIEDQGADTDTLTLHMGPAFSTATSQPGANIVSHNLNSSVAVSASTTASALPTFQLVDDGTLLSSLEGTQEVKTVLANLGQFS